VRCVAWQWLADEAPVGVSLQPLASFTAPVNSVRIANLVRADQPERQRRCQHTTDPGRSRRLTPANPITPAANNNMADGSGTCSANMVGDHRAYTRSGNAAVSYIPPEMVPCSSTPKGGSATLDSREPSTHGTKRW
jgi:hypothetical protein